MKNDDLIIDDFFADLRNLSKELEKELNNE